MVPDNLKSGVSKPCRYEPDIHPTYHDLATKPEVIELMQGIVDKTNAKFARVEQIKKFRMIPKELDHEDGELTATQKIKRRTMEGMYSDLVNGMYES